jgi:MFS transporter, CP family, cyanate transporter
MNADSYAVDQGIRISFASILCLLIVSFSLRPGIVSIGPVLPRIQQAFELSYSTASLLTSIPDVCMGIFVLAVPAITKRLGVDRTVLFALFMLGIAMFLRALSESIAALLVSTTFVGIGIAIAGALIGGWIKQHFTREAPRVMGIYAGGLSIGATIAASTASAISNASGSWRYAVAAWCMLVLAGIASWLYLSRGAPHPTPPVQGTTSGPRAVSLPWNSKRAWLVALFFGLSQFVAYACLAWLAPWNSETHASSIPGGLMLGLFTLLLACGSFAAGAVAHRFKDRRPLLAIGTIMTVIGFAGLILAPASIPGVFIALIAFGQGACFALGMTLPLDETASSEQAHAWTMFVLCIGYMIAALGPFAFGYMRDQTGGFFDSFALLLTASVGMLVVLPMFRPAHI